MSINSHAVAAAHEAGGGAGGWVTAAGKDDAAAALLSVNDTSARDELEAAGPGAPDDPEAGRCGSPHSHHSGGSKGTDHSGESAESEGLEKVEHRLFAVLQSVKYDTGKGSRRYIKKPLLTWFAGFKERYRAASLGVNHDHELGAPMRIVGDDANALSPCPKCAVALAYLRDDYNDGVMKGATVANFVKQVRSAATAGLFTAANLEGDTEEDAWRVAESAFVGVARRAHTADAPAAKSIDDNDAVVVLSVVAYNKQLAGDVSQATGSREWLDGVRGYFDDRNETSHGTEEVSASRLKAIAAGASSVLDALRTAAVSKRVKQRLKSYRDRIRKKVLEATADGDADASSASESDGNRTTPQAAPAVDASDRGEAPQAEVAVIFAGDAKHKAKQKEKKEKKEKKVTKKKPTKPSASSEPPATPATPATTTPTASKSSGKVGGAVGCSAVCAVVGGCLGFGFSGGKVGAKAAGLISGGNPVATVVGAVVGGVVGLAAWYLWG